MEDLKFNINSSIKVKLNEQGYQVLVDKYNEFVIPNSEPKTIEYFEKRSDRNGYTTFQLWDFMATFGPETRMGGNMKYSTDIILQSKDLEEIDLYTPAIQI